jgi:hypothetical protein
MYLHLMNVYLVSKLSSSFLCGRVYPSNGCTLLFLSVILCIDITDSSRNELYGVDHIVVAPVHTRKAYGELQA